MKHRIVGTAVAVALTVTGIANAGIIFVPVGGRFVDLDQTPVRVREQANEIRLRTTDLNSRLDCAGQPPDESFLAVSQDLRLTFDRRDGEVSGTVLGSMDRASAELALRGTVDGEATCFSVSGLDCGAIVVDLVIRNWFLDASDVGVVDQRLLGSLVRDGGGARWVRMDAEVRLGGPEDVVAEALAAMAEGESCGV